MHKAVCGYVISFSSSKGLVKEKEEEKLVEDSSELK